MSKLQKTLALLLCVAALAPLLVSCSANGQKSYETMADFEQADIGVLTGSSFHLLADEYFPQAGKLLYINISDLILNLENGRIDGLLIDKGFYTPMKWENTDLSFIEMEIPATQYAVAFPKTAASEPLKAQMDDFIRRHTEDGWLAELEAKWFSGSEPDTVPDFSRLTGENGTLRVATTLESKPFDYLKNGAYAGFDAELLFRFAQECGYALQIDTMDFGALLSSVSAGRYDLAISSITVTDERRESLLFSDTYCSSPVVMAVIDRTDTGESKTKPEDYATAKIGIATGSAHDGTAKTMFPNAQRVYFNTLSDMILAVEQGKIDCYLEDAPFLVAAIWEGSNVKQLSEPLVQMNNGFVFPQSEESRPLREQVNAFLAKAGEDGTIDRLWNKWMAHTEPTEHPDYSGLTGENGTIRLAVCIDSKPLLYKNNGGCTGFEIELLTLFAEQHGYAFEVEEVPFESILMGIAAGKYDMAAATLNITPEREERVDFSDPYGTVDVVMVVKGDADTRDTARTLADFARAKIGVLTGSIYDDYAKERFPDAERLHYSLMTDILLAVNQEKVDCYITEHTYVAAAQWEGAQVEAIDEVLDKTEAGYIFRKDDADSRQLRGQLNDFILKSRENGFLEQLNNKWFGRSEPTEHPDFDALTGENGTLRIAAATDLKPISYIKNGKLSGYEMELLWAFAKEYGYRLDISTVTFDSILPGVTTGKYDIGTGAITITEERAQSVDFSESHLTSNVVLAVKVQQDPAAQSSFWEEVKDDFHKTFIREDRWKLILEGIGVTVLISVCATIAGTLLGFGLYMLGRSDRKLLRQLVKGIAKVYSRIVAGTPMVVILMILFYVVFGSFQDMSGILVAIIGFTLTFGAFVYDHMSVSVNSVDFGQIEAAYALGYNKNKTFFRIVFPQAMTVFLPSYCGQAVDLVKATAVVGYIAVNDLTKMGDIIRSNTYEAFFPLIATAIIYFLLTWILSLLLGLVKRCFEPKRRSAEDILKGVKTV